MLVDRTPEAPVSLEHDPGAYLQASWIHPSRPAAGQAAALGHTPDLRETFVESAALRLGPVVWRSCARMV